MDWVDAAKKELDELSRQATANPKTFMHRGGFPRPGLPDGEGAQRLAWLAAQLKQLAARASDMVRI